ncbi:MAG: hypothetical protein QF393_10790 [Rhodospirillales bacterium]|nr:hypothetical protein [Rhodospirillales bacterium]
MKTVKSPQNSNTTPSPIASKSKVEIQYELLPSIQLIDGENEADFIAFCESCRGTIQPKDAIEEIWLRDYMDYAWESLRLRRMKGALIRSARREAVEKIINEYADIESLNELKIAMPARHLSKLWSKGEEGIVEFFQTLLEQNSLHQDHIAVTAVASKLDELERIDRLITAADYRRDKALGEIEKRRSYLAKSSQNFSEGTITDAEAEIIDAAA